MLDHKYFLGTLITIISLFILILLAGQVWAQWTPPPGAPGDDNVIRPLTNPLSVDLDFEYPAGSQHSIINAQNGTFAGLIQGNTVSSTSVCIGSNCRNSWPIGEVTNPMSSNLNGGQHSIFNLTSCDPKAGSQCGAVEALAHRNTIPSNNTFSAGIFAATDAGSGNNASMAVFGRSNNIGGVAIYGQAVSGWAGYFAGSIGVTNEICLSGDCRNAWFWRNNGSKIYYNSNNVGLGTDDPATKLEVADATANTAQLRITDTVQNPELQLQYGVNANDHWGIYVSNPNNSPAGDGNLIFWADGDNRLVMTPLGEISAYAYYYSSDQILKQNINTIYQPLEKIKQLRGVTFNWKETNEPSMGFVAQEVEKVLPELVKTNDQGLKSVQYANLTAILVEAVKTLQQQVEQLQAEKNINYTSQKICSVFVSGQWQDSIVVPNSWTSKACNDFRVDTGATNYQMGCLNSSSVTFGDKCHDSKCVNLPSTNDCGW